MSDTLTPLQSRFVQAILVNDGQQARAYLVASPKASQSTAEVQSTKLMQMPKIAKEIARVKDEAAERGAVTQDRLLTEYWSSYNTARSLLDITAARMCLDSIGKLTGFMDQNINVKHSGSVSHNLSDRTDAELDAMWDKWTQIQASVTVDMHELPQAGTTDTVTDSDMALDSRA